MLFIKLLKEAGEKNRAVGAFNFFNYATAKAVCMAAYKMNTPVIAQISVPNLKNMGMINAVDCIKTFRKIYPVEICLHLDHCKDMELAKACIDAGFDSVMIDASSYDLEENIRITKEVVDYAHARGAMVEGEIGHIGGVEDDISVDEGNYAKYEEVLEYVQKTCVDAVAPAIGTAHGIYVGKPILKFEIVKEVSAIKEIQVVIHGGSGLTDEDFQRLIRDGGTKINISTLIKDEYKNSIKDFISLNLPFKTPTDIDNYVEERLVEKISHQIDIFNNKC